MDWRPLFDTRPIVVVFDNTDLARPFRLEAVYEAGTRIGP